MFKFRFLPFLFLMIALQSLAQKNTAKIKFGDVKPEDFEPKVYSLDSNANAIVIADIADSKYEGSNNGWFNLLFNRIRRVRILNKNGFDEATVSIPLYFSGSEEEQLSNFEAATYNIEGGNVTVTKLDKASLFKDKYSKTQTVRKFTFPNLKEGSIIEYKYSVKSPFYRYIEPWRFQEDIPVLWSEYQVSIPNDILDFVLTRKGNLKFVIDTSWVEKKSYDIVSPGDATEASSVFTATSNVVTAHWAMQNVAPLKDESYITTLKDYIAGIDFKLQRIKLQSRSIEIMGTWQKLVDDLMKDDEFGVPITQGNGWLTDEMKKITAGSKDNLEKAKKVYNYIRDNFTCTVSHGMGITKPLKKTFQDKNGNVGDINLLLIAALKNIGLEPQPAILSTRGHGKVTEAAPIPDEYNYVICNVKIDDKAYNLDATNKMIGFGKLPEDLYNGSARLIADVPVLIPLSPDSIKESKVTTVFIINEENGKGMSASFASKFGEYEGIRLRQKMASQSLEDYFKEQKKGYSFETSLSEPEIDSLKIPDEPVTVKYNFTLNPDDDIVYFSPLLGESYKSNPFKSAERFYPVEMPYCMDETYILNMEIPKGYKVEEMPKSARVKLNDNDGMFEYIIDQSAGKIQLRCRVLLNKANFEPDDYQSLRDFFGYVVKKQAEQIVFKKG